MGLDEVADRLYALPPEDFTRARDAAAKDEPSLKEDLAALRRPTVAAWVVNVLAREDAATLDELLSLGPEFAAAQQAGDGDRLRTLSEQRRALLQSVTARAVELCERDIATAARGEVESTLEAALAHPASADAVRSGRLVRALSFAGFGGVDLEGAVAAPDAGPRSRKTGESRSTAQKSPAPKSAAPKSPARKPTAREAETAAQRATALEDQALEAAGRLDDAVRGLDAARRAQDEAAAAQTVADQAVAAAEQSLAAARQQQEDATAAHDHATVRTTEAEHAVEQEQASAEQARAALDRHRRATSD